MGTAQRIDVFTYRVGAYVMNVMDCALCGEVFGMLDATVGLRRRDSGWFYCPNGHTMRFPIGKSLEQRELKAAKQRAVEAEREAAHQKQMREWAERSAKGANIAAGLAKAAKQRLLHRVNCGVCPHCRRTFNQLAAHIKSKHPTQVPERRWLRSSHGH